MKADTGYSPTFSPVQERRIEKAGAILDKLDIVRRLIEMRPIDPKLALCRQLLGCVADDIAEMAGDVDHERREAEAIRRACRDPLSCSEALPALPLPERKRTILDRVDSAIALGVIGAAILGVSLWLGYSVGYHAGVW